MVLLNEDGQLATFVTVNPYPALATVSGTFMIAEQPLQQEGIFRDQFGLASAKICHGGERQGGPERFRPTSQASGERMEAAILQPPERGHNTSHNKNFSMT